MDTYGVVASRRDHKSGFADRPLPEEVVRRILDAGRLAGSAMNRQPWRFVVVDSRDARERLAETVYSAQYVLTAPLLVAVVATGGRSPGFDHGRAAQNMLVTAWGDGVASVPTGFSGKGDPAQALALSEDEQPAIVLAFGYPSRPRDPARRSPEEWSARAQRRPLEELVTRI